MIIKGKLKEQVDKAKDKEEVKRIIKEKLEEADLIIDDNELDHVVGGLSHHPGYK